MDSQANTIKRNVIGTVAYGWDVPAGLPPSFRWNAPVRVIQHRSVSGVITSREVAPSYSYPYGMMQLDWLTRTAPASEASVSQ